jgi:hypothetical protein
MKPPAPALKNLFDYLRHSIWLFPIVLFLIVLVFTTLKLHGSSVGVYHDYFEGDTQVDEDLIFGQPRPIRSDEWLAGTPLAISQYRNNFPVINPDFGTGHNVSLAMNLPYKEWSQIFKPQNIGFFVLPLEHAFALKWWLLSFFLIVASYFLVLEFFPGKRLLATLLSASLYLSPFTHWWYSDISFAPIFFALFSLLVSIKLYKSYVVKHKLLWALLLSYLLSGFILIQYPPFQIPVAFVTAIFYLGYLFHNISLKNKKQKKNLLLSLGLILVAVIISILVLTAFYLTRIEAFDALLNTVYPAGRSSSSGDRDIYYLIHLLGSQFQYRLQFTGSGTSYYNNQSEVSHFLFFTPYLFIYTSYLLYAQYKTKLLKFNWLLFTSMLIIIIFFVRYFIPRTDIFFDLILFNKSPNFRLLIGLGLASWLFLVAYIKYANTSKSTNISDKYLLGLATSLCFVGSLLAGIFIKQLYPNFIPTWWEVPVGSFILSSIVYLIQSRRIIQGLLLLGAISGFSVVAINPIYRGLDPLINTALSREIREIVTQDENARWTVNQNFQFEHYPLQNGAKTLNASYPYPHFELWEHLDPDRSKQDIYNRGAHVITKFKETGDTELSVGSPNIIDLDINPCSEYVEVINLKYVLSLSAINLPCVSLLKSIDYPKNTLHDQTLEFLSNTRFFSQGTNVHAENSTTNNTPLSTIARARICSVFKPITRELNI